MNKSILKITTILSILIILPSISIARDHVSSDVVVPSATADPQGGYTVTNSGYTAEGVKGYEGKISTDGQGDFGAAKASLTNGPNEDGIEVGKESSISKGWYDGAESAKGIEDKNHTYFSEGKVVHKNQAGVGSVEAKSIQRGNNAVGEEKGKEQGKGVESAKGVANIQDGGAIVDGKKFTQDGVEITVGKTTNREAVTKTKDITYDQAAKGKVVKNATK